jgi:transcriptional regulator with XRE-family HTH domain
MSLEERRQTLTAVEDMEFLLGPCDWEGSADEVIRSVGFFLMKQRESLKKTREELACQIGLSETMLAGIELARFSSYGATFQAYKMYANRVGITLKAAFLGGMTLEVPPETPVKLTGRALVEKARSVINELSSNNAPITGESVAELVGVPRSTLITSREVADLIAVGEAERLRKTEQNLVARAVEFLQDLYAGGGTCSQDALADYLGISRAKLRRTEQLMSLLRSWR